MRTITVLLSFLLLGSVCSAQPELGTATVGLNLSPRYQAFTAGIGVGERTSLLFMKNAEGRQTEGALSYRFAEGTFGGHSFRSYAQIGGKSDGLLARVQIDAADPRENYQLTALLGDTWRLRGLLTLPHYRRAGIAFWGGADGYGGDVGYRLKDRACGTRYYVLAGWNNGQTFTFGLKALLDGRVHGCW